MVEIVLGNKFMNSACVPSVKGFDGLPSNPDILFFYLPYRHVMRRASLLLKFMQKIMCIYISEYFLQNPEGKAILVAIFCHSFTSRSFLGRQKEASCIANISGSLITSLAIWYHG